MKRRLGIVGIGNYDLPGHYFWLASLIAATLIALIYNIWIMTIAINLES